MTTSKPGRLASELLEMADSQHRLGIMDKATHQKITAATWERMRCLPRSLLPRLKCGKCARRLTSVKPRLPGISI